MTFKVEFSPSDDLVTVSFEIGEVSTFVGEVASNDFFGLTELLKDVANIAVGLLAAGVKVDNFDYFMIFDEIKNLIATGRDDCFLTF